MPCDTERCVTVQCVVWHCAQCSVWCVPHCLPALSRSCLLQPVAFTPLSLARLVPDGVWRVAMGQSVCAMHLFKGGKGRGRSKCNYLLRPLILSKLMQC